MNNKKAVCFRCKGTNIKKDYERDEMFCADCGASYYGDKIKAGVGKDTCPDCGGTKIIHDPHAHDRICANCGVVIE